MQPAPEQLLRIEVRAARRAHHAYLQLKRHAWIGPRHQWCADQARALRDGGLHRARELSLSLARANGCDQPVSARVHGPKTPAAREQSNHVVAAGALTRIGGASDCATVPGTREAVV